MLVYNGNVEPETELPILVQQEFLTMTNHINYPGQMHLYSQSGERLYINVTERFRFIRATKRMSMMTRLFCLTLVYTGCRLSEARFLKRGDLQLGDGRIAFRTLKRRKQGVVREVPIPKFLVRQFLKLHFGELDHQDKWVFSDDDSPPPRISCYRWVKCAMYEAEIIGPRACPKGLRHGFGVYATWMGVQLHMLQRWMGHASMTTTAIYATAVGAEEMAIATRMWKRQWLLAGQKDIWQSILDVRDHFRPRIPT